MYFFRVLPEAGVAGLAGQQASSGDRKLRHHIQPGEPGWSFAQAHAYAHLSRSFREGASIALGGNGYTSLRFQDKPPEWERVTQSRLGAVAFVRHIFSCVLDRRQSRARVAQNGRSGRNLPPMTLCFRGPAWL